jgi:hypothetical protein
MGPPSACEPWSVLVRAVVRQIYHVSQPCCGPASPPQNALAAMEARRRTIATPRCLRGNRLQVLEAVPARGRGVRPCGDKL